MKQNIAKGKITTHDDLVKRILHSRQNTPADRSTLVAITGIDGCGKGYMTERLREALESEEVRVSVIGIDGWLNLPHTRFNDQNPAEHFYQHALRFDELFTQLVLPLRNKRSIRLEADVLTETATAYRKQRYEIEDIDVILLEGIYLLKRTFRSSYDLSVWIDCSFATALERAIVRAQEGLPPEETIRAYHTIYFPAQQIHFQRDNPQKAATVILPNDSRLLPEQSLESGFFSERS